jgi:nitrous oxide reductase
LKRRKFIQAAALSGLALAVGLNGDVFGSQIDKASHRKSGLSSNRFKGPAGGCTETNITMFSRGPRGRDPFGLYR